jgi:hypothetical protein
MAFNDQSIYKSLIASASITAFQLVKLDNAGKVTPCTASTDVPVGVSQQTVSSGDVVNVLILGLTRVIAGGTITSGTHFFVMPGLAGKVYAYDGTGEGTQVIAGRYLANDVNTAGSANEQIEILFSPCLGV